ncbi:MAG: MarR family transcriptional regulator [Chloroflexi bacterium]|nr:MAG: MarR family transcriptional regulator [Chloroflexota bacterium]
MVKSQITNGPEQLVSVVERIRAVMVTHLAPRWLELNLTMAQVHVLHVVRRLGPVSGRQLAAELGVSPAAVVPVCDRLAQQGWLERVRDESDRRIIWLRLTPSGLELVDGFAGRGKERITNALRRMSDEDRAALVRSLEALATAMEAE